MSAVTKNFRLSLALALGALAACSSAPDKRLLQYLNQDGFGNRYVGNAEEENYVSLGDTVQIYDTLHPDEVVGTQKVEIDGTILLPEVGPVHVAGYTRTDLQAVLTEKYSTYYDETDIVVKIKTKGKKYFIFGEVGGEGEKKFDGDLTIFEAVMNAKPDKNSSNLGRVRLIRADPVDPFVITVNINDILDHGDSTFNVLIQERDIVYVPPTLLAQLAYFIDDLLFPVKEVLRGLGGAFFYNNNNNGRNNRRNNNFGNPNIF